MEKKRRILSCLWLSWLFSPDMRTLQFSRKKQISQREQLAVRICFSLRGRGSNVHGSPTVVGDSPRSKMRPNVAFFVCKYFILSGLKTYLVQTIAFGEALR